jgi:predicted DNA binding CopG/RHH family protein
MIMRKTSPVVLKKLPKFKSDKAMRDFFAARDVGDGSVDLSAYDFSGYRKLSEHPEYAPKTRAITLRLSEALLSKTDVASAAVKMPRQKLIRLALEEKLARLAIEGKRQKSKRKAA